MGQKNWNGLKFGGVSVLSTSMVIAIVNLNMDLEKETVIQGKRKFKLTERLCGPTSSGGTMQPDWIWPKAAPYWTIPRVFS